MTADRANPVLDVFHRPMRSLRISVTDRCNLRCRYCMPEDEYAWVEREEILAFEEIAALTRIFAGLGVRRIRITGGEPLLRHDLPALVEMLAAMPLVEDLALTTNGVLLARMAQSLRRAGLKRVTVSLDTLLPVRFRALTRSGALGAVLEGIEEARRCGFEPVKINTVVMRGFNDDEIPSLLEFSRNHAAEIRFIEYMDVGGATRWSMDDVVTREEILQVAASAFGRVAPVDVAGREANGFAKAPADRFRLADGTVFGVISSTSQPFCGTCDRSRLTPDGIWLLCLYAVGGVNVKALLRSGAPAAEIAQVIETTWTSRADRGAEARKLLPERGVLFHADDLRKNLHLEMHTRGG
ncbi:MAG: GTP 3',8-cyclase MoaA [Terriglobia bacterium]